VPEHPPAFFQPKLRDLMKKPVFSLSCVALVEKSRVTLVETLEHFAQQHIRAWVVLFVHL
jgi:hypothetical protein